LNAGVLLVGAGKPPPSLEASICHALPALLPPALKPRYIQLGEHLIDHTGALAQQLGGLHDGVAIIRPDLYCAGNARWEDASALIERFAAQLNPSSC
jgi:hypothetical protein